MAIVRWFSSNSAQRCLASAKNRYFQGYCLAKTDQILSVIYSSPLNLALRFGWLEPLQD